MSEPVRTHDPRRAGALPLTGLPSVSGDGAEAREGRARTPAIDDAQPPAPAGSRMVDWESFYGALRQPGFVPGYEIQNHLGGGAFGEVYKARKTSIGKAYAIKFLKVDGDGTQDGVERELESVRLFAAIDHPHLVTIEDMGVAMNVPFLVMGYAGEDTLARRIQRGDLDPQVALSYFVQAARGVLALHDRRLAHFDLKPSNVFLNGDSARVGDYGLAKLLTEGRQTLSFGRGTPQYMAPEMLRNRADHRADIYSLGVILYESLTNRLPYESESGIGVVVREDDRPPDFPDSFPARLIPVVSRCLRLKPENRYSSVRELLVEMEQSTGRGDSIVLRPLEPGVMPPPLPGERTAMHTRGSSVSPPAKEQAPSGEGLHGSGPPESKRAEPGARAELRKAAAELVRGAREVTQSAIDGVRGATSAARAKALTGPAIERSPTTPAIEESAAPAEQPSVSSDSSAGSAAGGGPVGEVALEVSDIVSSASLDESDDEPPARDTTPTPVVPPQPAESLRAESVGTIPVPPRSEAGPFGTVLEASVIGMEMLGALVGWPLRVGTKLLARSADATSRAVPGVLGRVLRVLVFFLGFFLLGGLCALVLVAVFLLVAG